MPITRAKATALLNQREMALYDDSRANALRNLDEKALSTRISRAREARDRARDLVQRQKLSSRDRTGNKRGTSGLANQRSKDKVELTTDILRRFEAQLDKVADADAAPRTTSAKAGKTGARKSASRRADRRDARRTTRKAARGAGSKSASKSATKRSATAKKSSAKKAAGTTSKSARPTVKSTAKKAARKKSAAKKTGAARADAKKSARKATTKAAKKTAKKTAARKATKRALTPKQALKRTRALLEAKQARDREPKPWETLGGHAPDASGQPGFQSGTAARKALELHAGESRMPAIKGSISTRDRINQGKRDHRGGD